MAKRHTSPKTQRTPKTPTRTEELRRKILDDFAVLHVPVDEAAFDEHLSRIIKEGLTPLEFLARLIGEQADRKRERAIERRIRNAGLLAEDCTLEDFDWNFNAKTIRRTEIEELATCDFLRRRESLVLVGQSGLGKSKIVRAIGRQACVLGYNVRYRKSAELFEDLTAALADQTLPKLIRYYSRFDFLIIDEFGFDRPEREQCPQAASLLFKIIDKRGPQRSLALVTNVDFDNWADYLGDPPLAMAVLDRIVDGAIVLKLTGQSYRAHRAKQLNATPESKPKPAPGK